jgi:hypothetical protein
MTLHTGDGCSISRESNMLGHVLTDNCDVNASGQSENTGCQIEANDPLTYGSGFNNNGGGVYATEITSSFINIFFFPRGSLPSDISGASPDPSSWGTPMAVYKGDCDIASTFNKLQIVFTNTFCGDWAGNVWDSGSCASKADTCVHYVKNNPNDFEDAYWSVNSLRVYKHGTASSSPKATSSYSTSYSSSLSTSYSSSVVTSLSWQTPTVESTKSSRTKHSYSTKSTDIAMPSGVSQNSWTTSESSWSASSTNMAEASRYANQEPSQASPSEDITAASATSTSTAAEISTESRQRPQGWSSRGVNRHHNERSAKHLKKHGKHGSRRF